MTLAAEESSPLSSPTYALNLPNSGYESHDINARGQLVPQHNNDNDSDSDSDKASSVDGEYGLQHRDHGGTDTPRDDPRKYPRRKSDTSNKTPSNSADNQGWWNKIKQRGFGNRGNNLGTGNEIEQDTGYFFIVVAGIAAISLAVVAAGWFKPSK